MRPPIHVIAALAILTSMVPVVGQSPQAGTTDPAFEVATIKLNNSVDQRQAVRRQPGGRVTVTNIPARQLIVIAYQLQSFQLVGGPSWIGSDRFDMVAKLNEDRPPALPRTGSAAHYEADPIQVAMRALLADRFQLTVHHEVRQMNIYALVRAKPGGVLGAGLKPSTTDCSPAAVAARRAGQSQGPPGPPPSDAPLCGLVGMPGQIRMGGSPLSDAMTVLGQITDGMVVDRTGLTGNWDFTLTFQPEMRGGQLVPGVDSPATDATAPSVFTAVQEQLGLKLESTKGPVEVLVIDGIEHPTLD